MQGEVKAGDIFYVRQNGYCTVDAVTKERGEAVLKRIADGKEYIRDINFVLTCEKTYDVDIDLQSYVRTAQGEGYVTSVKPNNPTWPYTVTHVGNNHQDVYAAHELELLEDVKITPEAKEDALEVVDEKIRELTKELNAMKVLRKALLVAKNA